LPVAPSKKFLLPPEDFTPDKEVEEIIKLKLHHREKVSLSLFDVTLWYARLYVFKKKNGVEAI